MTVVEENEASGRTAGSVTEKGAWELKVHDLANILSQFGKYIQVDCIYSTQMFSKQGFFSRGTGTTADVY